MTRRSQAEAVSVMTVFNMNPIMEPAADFREALNSLPLKIISARNAPINDPRKIPSGPKKMPTIVPTIAPRLAILPPPVTLVKYAGMK